MVSQEQAEILKKIFNRYYVRWPKDTDEDILRMGAMKLKRRALGSKGIEITLNEEQVQQVLVKVGAAKKLEEAKPLVPYLDGLCITYKHKTFAADVLRVNRVAESNNYLFRVLG